MKLTRVSISVVAASAVCALLASACKPGTDLNRPCRLVKRNPDGGAALPILESEVKNKVGRNKDFISIGTVDCEDLICVRDADLTNDAGPFDPAFGYCSRGCLEGSTCPSYESALDKGTTRLNCRALLLDKETLAQLAGADGGSPGNVRDPFFCARGITPDAGL
jgi:hypothetical protein